MKPRIATLDGIFVLNETTGFYEPEAEPEQKLSRPWMALIWYGWIAIAALVCGAVLGLWRVLHG